jgi:hypothetical protein
MHACMHVCLYSKAYLIRSYRASCCEIRSAIGTRVVQQIEGVHFQTVGRPVNLVFVWRVSFASGWCCFAVDMNATALTTIVVNFGQVVTVSKKGHGLGYLTIRCLFATAEAFS